MQQHGSARCSTVCDLFMLGSSVPDSAQRDQVCSSYLDLPRKCVTPTLQRSQQLGSQTPPIVATQSLDKEQTRQALHHSMQQSALTSYLAARHPKALPYVAPAAARIIWHDLPHMHALQRLAVAGSMLSVQSVRSSMQQLKTAVGIDQDDTIEPSVITHVYTLQLPDAVCQVKTLRSLTVECYIPEPDYSSSEASSEDSTSDIVSLPRSSGRSLIIPGRRRSYEGTPEPYVIHVADPVLQLPQQLNNLTNLQHLNLAASFPNPAALEPLLGLEHLLVLALGPGEIDVRALVVLARGGVLWGVRRLTLQQQGQWDAPAFAVMLRGMQHLQQLEVAEFELARPSQDAAIPPEQHLTQEAMAPIASTLRALSWTTCAQRITQGSSMLGRVPAAGAAETESEVAIGSWIGGCTALRRLQLAGGSGVAAAAGALPHMQRSRPSVLSAPVLELLSPSIGECKGLEVLSIQGLGVPLLPGTLAQLDQLHTVSIASTRVARRAFYAADVALAALGSCKGLTDLTLAGCELRSLPAWLSGLQDLSSLNLQGNYLQDLSGARSSALGLPAGLRVLNLSDNRLRELPEGLAQLSHLQRLVLDENYLCSLPQQIWQLPRLTELSVRENMLPVLPELSGSCSSGANSSGIGSRASKITGRSSLDAITAPWKRSAVDAELSTAVDATATVASSRSSQPKSGSESSQSTPAAAAGMTCSDLRMLNLASNQLSQLPVGISLLTSLKHLDLSHNQFRVLPESGFIWALTRLTALQLSNNHLKKLPAGITNLQQLVELDLSGNHLPAGNGGAAGSSTSSGTEDVKHGAMPASTAAVAAAEGDGAAAAAEGVSAAPAAVQSPATQKPSRSGSGLKFKFSRKQHKQQQQQEQQQPQTQHLPGPLRALRQLQQVRMGGQQQEHTGGHQCPLQLLLGGLSDIIEVVRHLAPPHHQCPVSKAAAAAVAHFNRISSGRRGRRERARQLAERVRFEPGWVLLPAPKSQGPAAGGLAAGAAAAAGAGVGGW